MPPRARSRRNPAVEVLRVGHRPGRDPRLTTHLALAARAFGAERVYLHPPDPAIAGRLSAVTERWGGRFELVGAPDWRRVVREHPGPVVHLTMYGEPLARALPKLRRARRMLVVVGGAKVPSELYQMSDRNVAVGAQPHSEVAALAVFLDRLGPPPPSRWRGARQRIVPSPRRKRVQRVSDRGRR